jgi:hypothetical protein
MVTVVMKKKELGVLQPASNEASEVVEKKVLKYSLRVDKKSKTSKDIAFIKEVKNPAPVKLEGKKRKMMPTDFDYSEA